MSINMQVLIYKNICTVKQATYKTLPEETSRRGGRRVTILVYDRETTII
jgi:hypothetical protein